MKDEAVVPFAVLSMPRIDLQVPFPEKDEAKRLGARWDAQLKRWYIPEGMDHTAFDKWLPKPPSRKRVAEAHYGAPICVL